MNAINSAGDAIKHVLGQIRDNPWVGYHLGEFTETFSKLIKADREITYLGSGIPTVERVSIEGFREMWKPRNPKNPEEAAEPSPILGGCPCCGGSAFEYAELQAEIKDLVALYATDVLLCSIDAASDSKLVAALREKLERNSK